MTASLRYGKKGRIVPGHRRGQHRRHDYGHHVCLSQQPVAGDVPQPQASGELQRPDDQRRHPGRDVGKQQPTLRIQQVVERMSRSSMGRLVNRKTETAISPKTAQNASFTKPPPGCFVAGDAPRRSGCRPRSTWDDVITLV